MLREPGFYFVTLAEVPEKQYTDPEGSRDQPHAKSPWYTETRKWN